MKTYYLTSFSREARVIGDYPQCWEFTKGISETKRENLYKVHRYSNREFKPLPMSIRRLDGLKMSRRAKITDVLSAVVPDLPLVNDAVLNVVSNFNLGNYKIIPARIEREHQKLKYQFIFMLNDMIGCVDFPKSDFLITRVVNNKREEVTRFTGLESLAEFRYKESEEDKLRRRIRMTRTFMTPEFPSELDVFSVCAVQYSGLFVSEQLREALETNKITGVTFADNIIAIAP